ncbi:MAG TPA: EamA family transporter [Azospirillaceae bacterium]|nr:EamA family transporter [Azospirillaceae bacterium]
MSKNLALYAAAILIWGSTWYAINFQLGVVDPALSISYRFALAAAMLMAWLAVRGERLMPPPHAWRWVALTGVFTFSLNYLLVYMATGHLSSGLVAVGGSALSLMNILNARLFLKQPVRGDVLAGGVLGVAGVLLLFLPEFELRGLAGAAGLGFAYIMLSNYSASLGNMAVSKARGQGVPLLPATAWGMIIGSALMAGVAVLRGAELRFEPTAAYVGSLVYLALFGSVAAFLSYFTLIGRIGPDRAGYVAVMTPVLALVISTLFEDFHWTPLGALGLALAVGGNLLVMTPPSIAARFRRAPAPAE